MLLVTSLGIAGFHQYGQKMLKTLAANSTLTVRVYSEDQLTIPTLPLQNVPGWQSFQDDTRHIRPENYLYNAAKFSHKVYAQLDAFESGERYIVWLDGDIVFKKALTKNFLKKLVRGYFCAYLGRTNFYTETGFLIFDTQHDDFPLFKKRYRKVYDERTLFSLEYWIDCLAFDESRRGLAARNLTPDVEGLVDVFSRGPLKDICLHNKGYLKDE